MSEDAFSLGVKLGDLNDFITPSQACMKPVSQPVSPVAAQKAGDSFGPKIALGDGGVSEPVSPQPALRPTTISLNDCLACSGCITTAESVLISAQGTAEFLRRMEALKANDQIAVITISQESLASVATHFSLPLIIAFRKLITLFTKLGASMLLDAAFGNDLSLLETRQEIEETLLKVSSMTLKEQASLFPMMATECPGWVCYAEKTHHEVISRLNKVRSAMAMMGSIVKHVLAKSIDRDPAKIYHVGIMPCFDKKLEASRDDLNIPSSSENPLHEIDTVLASNEIIEVLQKTGIDFMSLEETPITSERCPYVNYDAKTDSLFATRSGQKGYWTEALKSIAINLLQVKDPVVITTPGRNSDMLELSIKNTNPTSPVRIPELRFAYAYGFRNIQNVVRKLKTPATASQIQFVEIMACPQSCINGGGQIRPPKGTPGEEWIQAVRSTFESRDLRHPEDNAAVLALLHSPEWKHEYSYTQFHAREKPNNPLALKW